MDLAAGLAALMDPPAGTAIAPATRALFEAIWDVVQECGPAGLLLRARATGDPAAPPDRFARALMGMGVPELAATLFTDAAAAIMTRLTAQAAREPLERGEAVRLGHAALPRPLGGFAGRLLDGDLRGRSWHHAHGRRTMTEANWTPSLELTEGQAPPIAANGGRSYLAFDRDGDAGTTAATEDALAQIANGRGQALIEELEGAPPGPIQTPWGLGFRRYAECLEHIRNQGMEAPEGGLVIPLRYTVDDQPSYSIVPSNALWHDPARKSDAAALRKDERDSVRRCLYFPAVLRDARRIAEYHPGLDPYSPESMDKLGVSLAHHESACTNFYDAAEVERVYYPEIEKLILDFFPDATDALVYNHDVFDKHYEGDRTEDQAAKNPGVNANYANLVHNDLNDNSGRVRCRELLTQNLRNFGREVHYTEAEAEAKMSRRFMSINLAKPMETVQQNPFVLCAWPSFADQPYINNYRVYDDRVGETTRFTYRPDHEWYWVPSKRRPRSRCSSATTRSPTARSRAGPSTPRASTRRRRTTRPAGRTWSSARTSSSRSGRRAASRRAARRTVSGRARRTGSCA